MKKQFNRRQALQKLQTIAKEVSDRNAFSRKESNEIADQITRKAIENLVKKGKVRFAS